MLSNLIKEQTKTNHQSLERKLITRMRAMRSKEDYVQLLYLFYSYFGGLEHLIADYLAKDAVPDHAARRKAKALAQDIELLGGKLPAKAGLHFLPVIKDHAAALGAMYVIEGSTLGGQIICDMLRKQLNLEDGISFFSAYGAQTMAMWKRFQGILDLPEHQPGDEIIQAANESFRKFEAWIDLNA